MDIAKQTLEKLENDVWAEPTFDSHLETTCHRLRKVPIDEFEVEDFRIMIGQDLGLKFLMPFALEILEENPLAEGDYYPGDLMKAVLTVRSDFWSGNREILRRCIHMAEGTVERFRSKWDLKKKKAEFDFGAKMDTKSVADEDEWKAYEICQEFLGKNR